MSELINFVQKKLKIREQRPITTNAQVYLNSEQVRMSDLTGYASSVEYSS